MDDVQLLKKIFTAQVLILANQIKAEKKSHGSSSTSDYTDDAIELINLKQTQIFRNLRP